jgi:nitroreductase
MTKMNSTDLIQQLNWRYAVKKFDSQRKISEADWKTLEESLILTPSSYGLQPWKFYIIKNPEVKQTLTPFTWKQTQVNDCSHYVVFTVLKKISEEHISKFIERTVQVRGGEIAGLEGYKKMMIGDVVQGARSQWAFEWAARQAYIALGNFMTAAAVLGIDTCPIEGFQPEKYDEVLNLKEHGLMSVVCCAAGYRSPDDKYSQALKVRFSNKDMVTHI